MLYHITKIIATLAVLAAVFAEEMENKTYFLLLSIFFALCAIDEKKKN